MLSFSKYSGCGNTFLLYDNRDKSLPYSKIAQFCQREVDGLIALESSSEPNAHRMRIFNNDGSEAEMCGNGIRCFVKFLRERGIFQNLYRIETLAGFLLAWPKGDEIVVKMTDPHSVRWDTPLEFEDKKMIAQCLNTGVPHAVIFTDDLESIPIAELGSKIRHHPFFGKEGTNVTFASLSRENKLDIRTFERGVEGETLACGTGATAAALAAFKKFKLTSPISVALRSKERLVIGFTCYDGAFREVTMQGGAKKLPV